MPQQWLKKILGEFVEDWKQAYKWASVQILGIVVILATYFEQNPNDWKTAIGVLPESIQPLAPMILGLLVLWSRLRKQGPKT